MDAVILVEGKSDRHAIETLAALRDRSLEGVAVVAIGGAHAIRRALAQYGDAQRLAGLCDAGEEADFRRALERAGVGSNLARADMERLGFFVCEPNLEGELVRAVGAERVEQVIEAEGELRAFRTFQKQPAKRTGSFEAQVHGFMWNRKVRYARLLVEAAVQVDRVPRPLEAVLDHALRKH